MPLLTEMLLPVIELRQGTIYTMNAPVDQLKNRNQSLCH